LIWFICLFLDDDDHSTTHNIQQTSRTLTGSSRNIKNIQLTSSIEKFMVIEAETRLWWIVWGKALSERGTKTRLDTSNTQIYLFESFLFLLFSFFPFLNSSYKLSIACLDLNYHRNVRLFDNKKMLRPCLAPIYLVK
jgi:hypothetical protein